MISSQWDYYASTVLTKSFALVGDGKGGYSCRGVSFNGSYYNSDSGSADLEWSVLLSDYYNNVIYQDNYYHDWGYMLNLSLPEVNTNTDGIIYRCTIYVRRKDFGAIYASDMQPSVFTWYLNRTVEVADNTLPADWLGTGTAAFVNPMETMTTVVPSEYEIDEDTIEDSIDIPQRILSAMGFVVGVITQILSLRYLTFMLCFGLVVGLLGWFLH